jgi:hypothetical protein
MSLLLLLLLLSPTLSALPLIQRAARLTLRFSSSSLLPAAATVTATAAAAAAADVVSLLLATFVGAPAVDVTRLT